VSTLSPLQLIAGAALANNTGVGLGTDFTLAVDAYKSTDLISPLSATLTNSQLGNVLGNLVPTLITLSATNCPALSDSTPSVYANNIGIIVSNNASDGNSTSGFTGIIQQIGNSYLGDGDNSIFTQVFTAAEGYTISTNQYILTVNNSQNYLGSNFTTMNSLITADLDKVNLAFDAFGSDLKNLGEAIGLANLDNLGSPLALLQQISTVAGLTSRLLQELDVLNISPSVVFDPPVLLAPLLLLEKVLYQTYQEITGNDLKEILILLNVTTPGINSLADLLNPVKMFPNSFFSLTTITVDGLRGIYLNQTGSVNIKLLDSLPAYVLDTYQLLALATPADQALANQCLRISFQQIKNIFNLSLPTLAESYLNLVTTKNLSLVNALTEPVPQSVLDYYTTSFATGSGPEGTLVLGDVIGAAIGFGYTNQLTNTVTTFNSLAADANFTNLVTVYQRMNTTISGGFGSIVNGPIVIPAGPAQGTYEAVYDPPGNVEGNLILTAAYVAFGNALIPNAQSFIISVVSSNPSSVDSLNRDWDSMAEQLIKESNNLANASIVVEDLIPDQRTSILGFIQNLPTYGLDTGVDGASEFLNQVADKNTIGGQSIIGSLRQGRNVAVLDIAGIGNDIYIPETFKELPPQSNIAPVEFTPSEAANLVIR
jgi:hypothetical protein